MASRWIVKRKGKEQGPFSSAQLKKLADKGQLRTDDLVRKHDAKQFVRAVKVKGLFDTPPASQSKPKRSPTPKQEIQVAEVVEVIEEPSQELEVLEEVNETGFEDDEAFDIDEKDVYEEDDFEYDEEEDEYEDYKDYDERPSRRPRRALQASPKKPSRSQRNRNKSKKKKAASEDDEEGPWSELFGGIASIAVGIGLFFSIGSEGVEITGVGPKAWLMMALNKIGGRWAMLIFFIFCGGLAIGDAIKKFRER